MAETHHTFGFEDENGNKHFVMRHWIHKKPRWSVEANGLYMSYMEDGEEINAFVPGDKGKGLWRAIVNSGYDIQIEDIL